ncbi:amino acid adenylation domain-containing protein [Streptomyces sp. BE20]|uniref:non-ribosomal peptide synthetase n=1 Tax=Streptomyces sp. BE20 TaxID=3002525 RepID=UPI002E779361|nr:non-ribosomal peptide synthetase [Streptomyces sp. BE20]MEE1821345.1 amino acid adenylation domain-containing protein [Streptomyces sp. BE20]
MSSTGHPPLDPAASPAELFSAQAERTPDALAVIDGHRRMTYRQLDLAVQAVADRLAAAGIGPEALVGVCLPRTADLVITLLAVLRAGGAYVPLDPAYPRDRLELVVGDARASVVATDRAHEHLLAGAGATLLHTGGDAPDVPAAPAVPAPAAPSVPGLAAPAPTGPAADPADPVAPADALAYVLYTSGSTGRPKGVSVTRRGVNAMLRWAARTYTPADLAGVLFGTSVCFDISVYELFLPLAVGGTVVVAENVLALPELPARDEVTLVNTVPSAMAALLRGDGLPDGVRVVNLAGEALPRHLADKVYAQPKVERLYNLYGPTEDTVYSTWSLVGRHEDGEPVIGRPLDGTLAHVLDERRAAVPDGGIGELYLSGEGLARGYHGRPDLTEERFVTVDGVRCYRTGDLVRRLPDGDLEYHGRVDHQVKVRGFRVELGEIEAVLAAHPAVEAAAAVVQRDEAGEYLAAFVQPAPGLAEPAPADLRAHCATALPGYMVPLAVAVLEHLPLTPNGKTDRKALPPAARSRAGHELFVAPRTPVETRIAGLWQGLLGVPEVGVHDVFLDLGGHSLLAAGLLGRIEREFGTRVPLAEFFAAPTVAALAVRVANGGGGRRSVAPPEREAHLPARATGFQRELWLHESIQPGSSLYNVPLRVRADGVLDREALGRALTEVVRRHEVLRTALRGVADPLGEDENEVTAEIVAPYPVDVPLLDLTGADDEALDAALRTEAARPLDLTTGRLLRALAVRTGEDRHELLLTVHHAAMDGWAAGLLLDEIARAHRDGELPEPALQLSDVARWEERAVAAGRDAARRWGRQLRGLDAEQHLPGDRPHPNPQDIAGRRIARRIDADLVRSVERRAAQEGASLYMAVLAALGGVLHRYTGRTDLAVLSPFAVRPVPELEQVLGSLINTVAIRLEVAGTDTFRDLVARVRPAVLEAAEHSGHPFVDHARRFGGSAGLTASPVSQVLLAVQNHPVAAVELPGLSLRFVAEVCNGTAKTDLSLFLEFPADGPLLSAEYRTSRYDERSVRAVLDHLVALLSAAVAEPDRPLGELAMLSAAELAADDPVNRTEAPIPDAPLHRLVADQAARTPDAVAVSAADGALTYAELDDTADRLAHLLASRGAGPGAVVAVAVRRGRLLPAALLGVLRSGAAYLPLDVEQPLARNRGVLDDAGVTLLVAESATAGDPLLHGRGAVLVDGPEHAAAPAAARAATVGPEEPAYLLYTSGSTGRPKGVAVPHRAIVNFLTSMGREPGLTGRDVMAAVTTVTFDIAGLELWLPLVTGARVEIADRATATDGHALAGWLGSRGVTHLQATPATWRMLLEAGWSGRPGLTALCGGEALTADLAEALLPRVGALWNLYGPTETTVWSTVQRVTPELAAHGGVVALGAPVANTRLHLLDSAGGAVPVNGVGELCIAGAGVALGYHGRPELTAERFTAEPGGPEGALMYRTGDLACRRADGRLEYHGRADAQVKLRGFRIELGEIEAALTAIPGVTAGAVRLVGTPAGPVLAGYVVTGAEPAGRGSVDAGSTRSALTEDELRITLAERLPDYMVPAALVLLDALPLTPGGKVDRAALPAPRLGGAGSPPEGDCEELLADLWQEVLAVERVGRHDDFFAIGGHSLLATRLLTKVRDTFETELPLRTIFEARTLATLARRIEERMLAEIDALGDLNDLDDPIGRNGRNDLDDPTGRNGRNRPGAPGVPHDRTADGTTGARTGETA